MLLEKYLDGVRILSVDEESLRESLQKIAGRLRAEHSEVKEIILFGSFSKNDYTPYSDIDIAIIVDRSNKKFIERSDDYIDYFIDIPFDTNLVVYSSEEIDRMIMSRNSFAIEIRKGIRL
jgi:predicted nucleotidyltransferase